MLPRCRQLAAWRPSPTDEEGEEKDEGYAESIGHELLSEEFLFHLHAARESATLWRYHSGTPGVLAAHTQCVGVRMFCPFVTSFSMVLPSVTNVYDFNNIFRHICLKNKPKTFVELEFC